ncbi:hypothetical protein J6590_105353 [Homalodisca vitripennis]|nr:hypothetical protein J6590_105353 [Homalodisca vitripennis]
MDQLTDTRPACSVGQRTRPLAPLLQVRSRPNPFPDNRPDCARSDIPVKGRPFSSCTLTDPITVAVTCHNLPLRRGRPKKIFLYGYDERVGRKG